MPSNSAPTIVVVEDDAPTRLYLIKLLSGEGFNVIPADDGANALRILSSVPVDLVLSDIMMPMVDGVALYEKVQQDPQLRHIPFIFLTASPDQQMQFRGVELGVDAYLRKPPDREMLLANIRGKLKRSAAQRASRSQELEKLKQQVLAALTNEVKTPIKIIRNVTALLADQRVRLAPNQLSELLTSIKVGGDRLQRALEDFEMTFKIESGEIRKDYESDRNQYDLWGILNSVLATASSFTAGKNLQVTANPPTVKPVIVVSRNLLKFILDRLLYGATALASPRGKLDLQMDVGEDQVKLFVCIVGTVLRDEDVTHAFEKYYSFRQPTTDEYPVGLSLSNAKLLAEVNRGELTCATVPSTGTTFVLALPRW